MGLEGSRLICWGDQVGSTDAGGSRLSRRFMFVEEVGVPMTELGESPHWCSITESLFYVDITANLVCQYSPSSKVFQSMKMDSAVGFAIPTEQTKRSQIMLLVGLEDRIVEVNFTTKNVIRTVATLPDNLTTDCRFNDGKCNHHGRLYAGYMNKKWREGIYGNVYRLVKSKKEPGSIDPMRLEAMFEENEIILPNGLIWRKDGYVFYIDSGKNVINSYKETSQEKPAEKGTSVVGSRTSSYLKKISTVYKLNDDDILSGYLLDGMTLDCNGKIWVALVGASCLIQIDPNTGKEMMRLRLPVKKPTACTFGGPDLSDLYITSRGDSAEPTGKLYVARLHGVTGANAGVPVAVESEDTMSDFIKKLFFFI